MAELGKMLKRAIVLRDIAGEDIHNSGRYGRGENGCHRPIQLIVHNGYAWSKDLLFPQSREVHFYEGDTWHAIRELPTANRLRSGSWAALTDNSQSTSSCCRTVAPIERKRLTKDSKRSAPD